MITEYRALRASVLKIWARQGGGTAAGRPDGPHPLQRGDRPGDRRVGRPLHAPDQHRRGAVHRHPGARHPQSAGHHPHERRSAGAHRASSRAKAAAPIVNAAARIKAIIEQVVDFTRGQSDGVMPVEPACPATSPSNWPRWCSETQVRHPEPYACGFDCAGEFDGSVGRRTHGAAAVEPARERPSLRRAPKSEVTREDVVARRRGVFLRAQRRAADPRAASASGSSGRWSAGYSSTRTASRREPERAGPRPLHLPRDRPLARRHAAAGVRAKPTGTTFTVARCRARSG